MTTVTLREVVPHVEDHVRQQFPHRIAIVSDAVMAHRQRRYAIAIPTLLAQADGMAFDILGTSLYSVGKSSGALREVLGALQGTPEIHWLEPILVPLLEGTTISVPTGQRDTRQRIEPSYGPLNRHGVLHGLDNRYARRVNSCRALVMIDYLCSVPQLLGRDVGGVSPTRFRG